MIEDQITTDPIIHNILQQYPENEWNRVLKALSILGIQTLNNFPQNKFYTVDELEQLINSQNSMKVSQEVPNNNEMIIKEEEEITTSMANKDIEQHINHNEQQENEQSQITPKAAYKEVNAQNEQNMKQPLSYSYQNNQFKRTNFSYSPKVELNASSNQYTYNTCTSCHCNCYGHHHCCSSHYHCHHHHHYNDDCIYCRCYCDDCISRRVRLRMLSSSNPSLSMNYSKTNSYSPSNRY